MLGTLYVVATPIGNLSDVTQRAKETFSAVDVILCEDTRVTQKLIHAMGLSKPLLSYHQHSGDLKTKEIFSLIKEGKQLALVTDAGTPGINDPGGKLIKALIKKFGDEVVISPIPGPSALISALSVCGFPADEFVYLGFPPHKKGRQTFFRHLNEIESTAVYFESTHRILKSLEELHQSVGNRPVVVCRELTKLYETIYRGSAAEVIKKLELTSIKGEFVIVLSPKKYVS